ncbi:bifunctional [glutamine synthetase] adenylyltransferase/[glutamine synthetase]-adenylyl-L-tyrosine phosphorylase [Nocardioides insulae]|uniref:bifunctional [glutamine synthetase] adenylyltransferase/[glutamine synthetase]-adenylyl-L-tyrosine phosphorylase n=1 Tax=Nocardioides insulae TaxID=394734 RepID=UPI0004169703|nr:bifunctional [glutamine synthetase] adenylyltransferase/[glutamine synthetase]-adenylyl-L-tyrosine phosphorylase [Nocardioides insulae]
MARNVTGRTRLIQLGFLDSRAAEDGLARLGECAEPILPMFGRAADPDLALSSLLRLLEAMAETGETEELIRVLADDEGTAMRLTAVLGASVALGDHLVRHPEQWHELRDPLLGSTRPPSYHLRAELMRAVGADPDAETPVATLPDPEATDQLRVHYRRLLLRLAARDLGHHVSLQNVAAELSDLACGTLDAALAVARARVGDAAGQVRLAVIAMGKTGGHELNYVSDVDVVFVHAPAEGSGEPASDEVVGRVANRLAAQLIQVCSEHTAEGRIWEVDPGLRPEGKNGPLSRTLASHAAYYGRWASTWEFQALLKVRPAAGDRALARAYDELTEPLVWSAAERDGFVTDTQLMRRRVIDHLPAKEMTRQLKLGPGGLRDVEFAVQMLQLVHGRFEPGIHLSSTLEALAALTRLGYVGRADGEALQSAYTFLRTLEHRIQLYRLQRTHVVPDDEESLRHIGRSMGYYSKPAETLVQTWQHHRLEVRRLHQKLFYRPLLTAVARLQGEEAHLTLEAAGTRLAALGYEDPKAALRHLEALTAGVSRRADIQRALLPVMLQWFAEGPDPDAGLFGFRRISEALGTTPWYLRTLRDEGQVAENLARILSTSRYATALLEREPEGVRMLGGSLAPRTAAEIQSEMLAGGARREDPAAAVRAIRAVRRRELLRIAAADLVGEVGVLDVAAGLSRLTDATLESALNAIGAGERRRRGLDEAPTRIAVIAMGRYGGFELSYGSDADVLFVHRPEPGVDPQLAAGYAQSVAHELQQQLGVAGPDPALKVDADLRPEGRQGPLVRTLEAYAGYYAKWSAVWEAQALLRADAVVGDEELRAAFTELIDPLRYPAEGLTEDQVREVRRIKGRVDSERLPRGADPKTHLKLGRGGLADIEWSVQLLQMRHGHEFAQLRTPRTLAALAAAAEAGLVEVEDAAVLEEAWRMASRLRNAITLVRGKPSDQIPAGIRERSAMAAVLGYPPGGSEEMVNDHLRLSRLAKGVVDRVFWE